MEPTTQEPAKQETVAANVASGVAYAGFWRRFTGWLIDFLIIIILGHWASLAFSSLIQSQTLGVLGSGSFFSSPFSTEFGLILAEEIVGSFIIITLYYCLFEASSLQATVGKYIVGIKVTDMHGQRITYGRAFLRRASSILSTIPIFIGFIVAGFTSKKQTFHDMLAKTVVVIKKKRNGWLLFCIVIVTVIVGVLSPRFLGAGFNVSYNSPTTTYNNQNGLQNYSVESGDQVDPALENTIITAYEDQTPIYASGNPATIRSHLLMAIASSTAATQEVENMSDSDLLNYAAFMNNNVLVLIGTSTAVFHSPETEWAFGQGTTTVKITFSTTTSDGQTATVDIDGQFTNGHWYF